MSSLPPALNFAEAEDEICKKWKEENSFHRQNELSEERGDDVSWLGHLICTVAPHSVVEYETSANHIANISFASSFFSNVRNTFSSTDPLSRQACRTTDTFLLVPSRIL